MYKIEFLLKEVDLFDYYITKNICDLVKDHKFIEYINNKIFLLGYNNKLGKNSLNILLENKRFDVIINLLKNNYEILNIKNIYEQNLLQKMIIYDYFYDFIIDLIKNYDNKFVINLITNKDQNYENFIDDCVQIILLNENNIIENKSNNDINFKKILEILKGINNLENENLLLVITTLCRSLNKENTLMYCLKYINPQNLDLEPDFNNLTIIDYLIGNNNIIALEYLLERINYIYFVNYNENPVFKLIENYNISSENSLKDNKKIIKILFTIISKSNLSKINNINNENILIKIFETFDITIPINELSELINSFDIFEQTIDKQNLYEIILKKI